MMQAFWQFQWGAFQSSFSNQGWSPFCSLLMTDGTSIVTLPVRSQQVWNIQAQLQVGLLVCTGVLKVAKRKVRQRLPLCALRGRSTMGMMCMHVCACVCVCGLQTGSGGEQQQCPNQSPSPPTDMSGFWVGSSLSAGVGSSAAMPTVFNGAHVGHPSCSQDVSF